MTHRLVAAKWETYCRFVHGAVPVDMPPEQMQRVRRAFYAGAKALFTILIYPGEEPTEADDEYIDAINTELDTFARAVAEGHA